MAATKPQKRRVLNSGKKSHTASIPIPDSRGFPTGWQERSQQRWIASDVFKALVARRANELRRAKAAALQMQKQEEEALRAHAQQLREESLRRRQEEKQAEEASIAQQWAEWEAERERCLQKQLEKERISQAEEARLQKLKDEEDQLRAARRLARNQKKRSSRRKKKAQRKLEKAQRAAEAAAAAAAEAKPKITEVNASVDTSALAVTAQASLAATTQAIEQGFLTVAMLVTALIAGTGAVVIPRLFGRSGFSLWGLVPAVVVSLLLLVLSTGILRSRTGSTPPPSPTTGLYARHRTVHTKSQTMPVLQLA